MTAPPGHARWCQLGEHPPGVPCSEIVPDPRYAALAGHRAATPPAMSAAQQDGLVRELAVLVIAYAPADPVAGNVTERLGLAPGAGPAEVITARLRAALGMAPDRHSLNRSSTGRGFDTYDQFRDTYDTTVTVRESSAAEGPRCWIFTSHPSGEDAAAHLDVPQARRVRHALGAFITEHGEPL